MKFDELYKLIMEQFQNSEQESLQDLIKKDNTHEIYYYINHNELTNDQKDKLIQYYINCRQNDIASAKIDNYKNLKDPMLRILQQLFDFVANGIGGYQKLTVDQKNKIVNHILQKQNYRITYQNLLKLLGSYGFKKEKELKKKISTYLLNNSMKSGDGMTIYNLIAFDSKSNPGEILTEEQRKSAIQCLIDKKLTRILQKFLNVNDNNLPVLFDSQRIKVINALKQT